MQFYGRDLTDTLKKYMKYPVIALLGPRQSGKTTLAKNVFKNHVFLNMEDFELRALAIEDPNGFLRKYENDHGLIIDEFHTTPQLLSAIQVVVDAHNRPGYFVLTGSQNFLMNYAISQSLAGRVGILTLLPFSINELEVNKIVALRPEEAIFTGGYPRLYTNQFEPHELYPSYINTYVERDIRQLVNVANLHTFQKFLKLCAARVGQLLNFSDLAISCGISVPTIHQWLSVLEASYIIFLLRPHWTNFNKRMTKTPKLYFCDTGLACSLLEIDSAKSLLLNQYYGNLFENFIIADLYKQYYNQGLSPALYFWRDQNGAIEVDCVIEKNATLTPIEIKAGETYSSHYCNSLTKWNAIAKREMKDSYLVYGGNQSSVNDNCILVPWQKAGKLLAML